MDKYLGNDNFGFYIFLSLSLSVKNKNKKKLYTIYPLWKGWLILFGIVPAKSPIPSPSSLPLFPKINTAPPWLTIIPFTALVLTLQLVETVCLYQHSTCRQASGFPFLCSRPGPEGEACVGVMELTGLSGLCLLCWLFPFPLFTAASTAAVYPTVTEIYRRG